MLLNYFNQSDVTPFRPCQKSDFEGANAVDIWNEFAKNNPLSQYQGTDNLLCLENASKATVGESGIYLTACENS